MTQPKIEITLTGEYLIRATAKKNGVIISYLGGALFVKTPETSIDKLPGKAKTIKGFGRFWSEGNIRLDSITQVDGQTL